MSQYTQIGKRTPLIDGRVKVNGALNYLADITLPGMLHARFVSSPYAHANIRSIDTTQALALPGVAAVLTAADMPDIPPTHRAHLLLARGRVVFAGQPVALVLAGTETAAEDGIELVYVDYESLPAALTIDETMAEGAPLVWENDENSNITNRSNHTRGDVKAGFAQADVIIERSFDSAMVHQSPIEPQATLVQPDPLTGGARVWSSTQAAFDVRRDVAAVLDVPESEVRVTGTPVGGGFGSKGALYDPLVALAARVVNRPVRLALTRSEEMIAANPAPPIRVNAKIGAKSDGMLTAFQAEVIVDGGCFNPDMSWFTGYLMLLTYQVPNFEINGIDVVTFKQSTSAYRAPGAPTAVLVMDSMIDDVARELKLDPLEVRAKNISKPGDLNPEGREWVEIGAREVLDAVRQHPLWQNRAQSQAKGRGVGIAVGGWGGATDTAASVCRINRDGKINITVGSADISGTTTTFALMAAEVFGVTPGDIKIISPDTETAPYAGFSGGSKVTFSTGAAVIQAAEEARRQVLAIAAEEFEAAVEDLEIINGAVQVRGVPAKSIKLGEIAAKSMQEGGKYPPIFAHGRVGAGRSAPAFNAQLIEVEVDQETGEVRICNHVSIQDVGTAINPMAIEGQLMGGGMQGIGWGLYEQLVYDDNGQLLTGTYMDYALPHSIHAAENFEAVIVEVPSPNGVFGVRGVGEPPVIPTAAAISNAIKDATGVRVASLPMTPPKVLAALQDS